MMKSIKTIFFILAVYVITILAGSAPVPVQAAGNLSDISGNWAYAQIVYLVNKGAIGGYADGTFRPDRSITRAEFITMVNRNFDFQTTARIAYSDVQPGDWYYEEIARARAAGYIEGYSDGTMRPNNRISRQEAAVIMAEVLDLDISQSWVLSFRDSSSIPSWSRSSVAAMVKSGRISGYPDGSFRPRVSISRAESAVMVSGLKNETPAPVSQGTYNIKNYGAAGNGSTDDSNAIQAAANAARKTNGTLVIPSGSYLIGKNITIYTSVDCQGKILVRNSSRTPGISIEWSKQAIRVAPSTLSGLTRGSARLGGLNGYKGGTVVMASEEPLIRTSSAGGYYTKNEASEITGNEGQISPALDCTYSDLSKLAVTVHPYESPIVIEGLNVESTGVITSNQSLVSCYRDNITFNGLKLANTGACNVSVMNVGLTVRGCRVTINDPVIKGFSTTNQIGNGYGILYGSTSFLTINNANITECNGHAAAGRHNKEVRINGGYFSLSVDDHWGSNMVIDGATIDGFVSYAGTDITIRNCTYVNCSRLLVVRGDTPELMGTVLIDNIYIRSLSHPDDYVMGFGYSQSRQTTDYGRTLKAPDLVSITNVKVNMPAGGKFDVLGSANPKPWISNPVEPIKQLYAANISTVNNLGTIIRGY